ncbi:unnamed protein product [Choristocarpus tenellus]
MSSSLTHYLGTEAEGMSPDAAAGILVDRLKNAGDLGDRRDALEALLGLSETHPAEVGQAGMPVFTDILQAGIADGSMSQTIIEIMLNLVTGRGVEGTGGGPGIASNIAAILMDIQNVQNLLDLLESPDTLTALSAVQVLQELQGVAAHSLETSILECHASMQALMEALRDPREEVRNEVILLLGKLTATNHEVKKFVAFQEGFERLFSIMREEGMLEGGGVIVKDCLDVCLNLMMGSSVTQLLFCQSGCLNVLHELFDVRVLVDTGMRENGNREDFNDFSGVGENGADEEHFCVPLPSFQVIPLMTDLQSDIVSKAVEILLVLLEVGGGEGAEESQGQEKEQRWFTHSSNGDAGVRAVAGGGGGGGGHREKSQSAVAGAASGLLVELLVHVAFSRAEPYCLVPLNCRRKAVRVMGAVVEGCQDNQHLVGEVC